jgi:hypothetical protein
MTDVVFLEDTIFYKKGSVVQLSDADLEKYKGKGIVEVLWNSDGCDPVAGVADVAIPEDPQPTEEPADEPTPDPQPAPTTTRQRK